MHFDSEGHAFVLITRADDGFGNILPVTSRVAVIELCPILPDELEEIMIH